MTKYALAWILLIASALFLVCPSHVLGESQTREEALRGETIGNSHNAAVGSSTKFEDEELTAAPVSASPSSPKVLPLSGFNTTSSLRSSPTSPPPPPPPADDDDDVEVNESGDDDDDSSGNDDSYAAPVIPAPSPPTQTPSPPLSPPATSSNQPVAPVPPISSTPSEAQNDGYTSPDDPQAHGRGHNTSSTVCGDSSGGNRSSSSSASAGSGEPTATASCIGDSTAGAAASHSNDGSGSDAVVHGGFT